MTAWALTQCPNSISPVGTTSSEHLQDNINGQKTLWVAGGINRDNGKLTYPTAMNNQDIIIFAFTKSGTYCYNPEGHTLTLIAEGNNRALTGSSLLLRRRRLTCSIFRTRESGKAGLLLLRLC